MPLKNTIATGEAGTVWMKSVGVNEEGNSSFLPFNFEWNP